MLLEITRKLRNGATAMLVKFAKDSESGVFNTEDLSKKTKSNDNFRDIVYTGPKSQISLMSLNPGEDIGEEIHDVDQFFRIEEGTCKVTIDGKDYNLGEESAISIPSGSLHNVVNTGEGKLKLYTIYSPPHHKDGVVQKTKNDKEPLLVKTAKHGEVYSYASTQVDLPDDLAKKVMSWGKENIDKDDLAGVGFEDEIHATVLYGLTIDTADELRKHLRYFRPFEIELGLTTHFSTPEYDVLKISVKSPVLESMHYFLENNVPNDNSFPTYYPHVTIAYLRKGSAKKYIGSDHFCGDKLIADGIVFSSKDHKKVTISLK